MALKKNLGFFGVFSLATGAMISSGIFILPSMAYSICGSAVFLAYLLAGVLAFIGIQSIIELSTAMPMAGGDYFFISRSLGPLFGTVSGMLGWMALALKSAFAVYGLSEVCFLLFGIPRLITGGAITFIFVLLNSIGAKEASIFQTILVIMLVSILSLFIIMGLPRIEESRFLTLSFTNPRDVFLAASFVFVSFGGLLKVANVAEEVKNPKKNIPLGIMTSICCVTLLYTLSVFVVTGVLPPEIFLASGEPVADAALKISGSVGFYLITFAASLAFITTANAGVMAASRYPLSLSRDGLLPLHFRKLNKKKMPFISIFLTGLVIFVSLLFSLEMLIKIASTVILASYILTNLSVIVLRESKINNYKPSYSVAFYPWIQIFCIIVFTIFIYLLGTGFSVIALLFILGCFLLFIFYGRKHYEGEAALLHIIKRYTDKRITEGMLENELREIVISRDGLEQDEFDALVKNAVVLDIQDSVTFSELLSICSEKISKRSGLSISEVIDRFEKREAQITTVLSPYIAVPHIVTENTTSFFLVMVRCVEGVSFYDDESVKAIFLFGGPEKERTMHIKILSAIAERVRDEDFQEQWEKATDKDELKDIFILGRRNRLL